MFLPVLFVHCYKDTAGNQNQPTTDAGCHGSSIPHKLNPRTGGDKESQLFCLLPVSRFILRPHHQRLPVPAPRHPEDKLSPALLKLCPIKGGLLFIVDPDLRLAESNIILYIYPDFPAVAAVPGAGL